MRNQLKLERASTPTLTPSIVTKCASCAHRTTDFDCLSCTQRTRIEAGRCIVLECSGYTAREVVAA